MRTKLTIALMVLVLVFYSVLIGYKGVGMIRTGSAVGVVLGIAILVVPVLGLLLVWREIEFGRRISELARDLEAQGGLPVDDLPRRPSGKVDRAAADALFEQMRQEAEASPDDWRAWFRLALAYDAAGDRTRARGAARHALTLHS